MINTQYREATQQDIPALAQMRAIERGTQEFWTTRISGYMKAEHHPQQALLQRIIYIAADNETIVGFIAGHLTQRFECDGELQWINVSPEYRRNGVASALLKLLVRWFIEKNALHICANADADNPSSQFYRSHGAKEMNKHWLVWKNINVVMNK